MGIDDTFPLAFAKSQDAAYGGLPSAGVVFVSVSDRDKRGAILPVARLRQLGYEIWATAGTAEVLSRYGVPATVVAKHTDVRDDATPSIVDLIADGQVDIIINTPRGARPVRTVTRFAPQRSRQTRRCSPPSDS